MDTIFLFYCNELIILLIILINFLIYFIEKVIYKEVYENKLLIFNFILLSFVLYNLLFNMVDSPSNVYVFDNLFVYSNFIKNMKIFLISLTLFFIIYLYNFIKIVKLPLFEYITLILISILSIFLMISTNNIFFIFLFLEILNLCLYVLIGINKYSNFGIELSYKYFIQSSFATLVGLFGVSLIYMKTSTLNISELNFIMSYYPIEDDTVLVFSFLFILFTFFFKLGLFPFHAWVADLYQNTHLVTVVFISIIPKMAYIYIFYELTAILEYCNFLFAFLTIISTLTISYGMGFSIYETGLRRLLGYSSLVHMGFIILAIMVVDRLSISAAFFYIVMYSTVMFLLFLFLLLFAEKRVYSNEITFVDNITSIGKLLNNNTPLAIIFSFCILSLAGLPFFVGFFAKLYILLSLISYGYFFVVIYLLILNILSTIYYIRLIRFLFFSENRDLKVKYMPVDVKLTRSLYDLIMGLFILNILILFFHNYIYLFILNSIITI